jgi:hypothetical protein
LDPAVFVPVVQCIRETAASLCDDQEIGWSWADDFLKRCNKVARDAFATRAGFIDLTPDINRIKQELVEPRRSAWDTAHPDPKASA